MLRLLSQRAVRQMGTLHHVLWGSGAHWLPAGVRCTGGSAPRRRWVSTSVAVRTAQPGKSKAEGESPPGSLQDGAGAGSQRTVDSAQAPPAPPEEPTEIDPLQDKSIGLYQRFKKTFKQYGKVMIPVHLVTSSIWFGTFYYGAMKGVNVVPFLEFVGLPETVVGLLRDSQSGYALTAYAMYKIATPARYTVTLGGTSLTVKYLRKHGYVSTPPPVKEYFQDRMEETRERLSEKMEETKERFSEKMEETRELFSGRMEGTKGRISDRMEETKGRISDRVEETKGRISDRMEETKGRISDRVEETKDKLSEKLLETKDKVSFRKKE